MRIEELKLIPPNKRSSAVLIEFMREHEKGLKAIKTLAEIKEIAEPYNDMSGNCVIVNFFKDMNVILQKINECEINNEC